MTWTAMALLLTGVLLNAGAQLLLKAGTNVLGDVALAPYHDWDAKVPADVKSKMDAILKGLRDGSIKTNVPPTKPGGS